VVEDIENLRSELQPSSLGDAESFIKETSASQAAGPYKIPRPAFPKVPAAGIEKAAGFQNCARLWLWGIAPTPYTTFGRWFVVSGIAESIDADERQVRDGIIQASWRVTGQRETLPILADLWEVICIVSQFNRRELVFAAPPFFTANQAEAHMLVPADEN
jgi:hypothetical protein